MQVPPGLGSGRNHDHERLERSLAIERVRRSRLFEAAVVSNMIMALLFVIGRLLRLGYIVKRNVEEVYSR